MNTVRVGLYARVSTDDQSPEMQINALRKYCEHRGWIIAEEISETASGSITDRPERARLIKLAMQRKLDAIAVWKLDRWGRSTIDVINTVEELKAVGVIFVSITEAIDLSTPLGQMFLAVCAAFAQLERDLIQERIKEGVRRYREVNGTWGRPATAQAKSEQVKELHALAWSKNKIAKTLGISRASVIRILKEPVSIEQS
jgi:DNA invertase Pin-like site-specific DNA recombinase